MQPEDTGNDGNQHPAGIDPGGPNTAYRRIQRLGSDAGPFLRVEHDRKPSIRIELRGARQLKRPSSRLGMIGRVRLNAPMWWSCMIENLTAFLLHWGITALSLWVASHVFSGIKFADTSSLIVSALLLGFANAIVKPLLIVLTLPLTLLTFGLFLLVINALMILLVANLVRGFTVSSFWTAFFASIFIALFSLVIGSFVLGGSPSYSIQMPRNGVWL
jgi:putative membrane protein